MLNSYIKYICSCTKKNWGIWWRFDPPAPPILTCSPSPKIRQSCNYSFKKPTTKWSKILNTDNYSARFSIWNIKFCLDGKLETSFWWSLMQQPLACKIADSHNQSTFRGVTILWHPKSKKVISNGETLELVLTAVAGLFCGWLNGWQVRWVVMWISL